MKVKRHKAERERERAGRRDGEKARHKVNTEQFTHRSTAQLYSNQYNESDVDDVIRLWDCCSRVFVRRSFTKRIKSARSDDGGNNQQRFKRRCDSNDSDTEEESDANRSRETDPNL